MELTKEKSEELAQVIIGIRLMLQPIDLDYCRAVASEMVQQPTLQSSCAL